MPKHTPRPALTFDRWNNTQINDFFARYRNWESLVHSQYKSIIGAADEHYEEVTKHSLSLNTMLRALPAQERKNLITAYKKNVIQFEDIMARHGKPNHLSSDAARLNIDPTLLRGKNVHPLAVLYNRMFLQYDNVDDSYRFGANIMSSSAFQNLFEDIRHGSPIKPNSKILVFDTETTGLQHESGIRQISYMDVNAGTKGKDSLFPSSKVMDSHFKTARMQWGYLAAAGKNPRRMDTFFKSLYKNSVPGSGDDFVREMTPFLRKLIEADFVAGQNIQFDLDQVLIGLSKTSAYLSNQGGFADLLNQARSAVLQPGKVKDTLEIARTVLPDIGLARELKFAKELRPHSLENIMLQTNFMQLLKNDIGETKLKKMLGIGKPGSFMHDARIDTRLEAYLLKYLYATDGSGNPMLRPATLGGSGLMDDIRRWVLKSYAPTPISNIADISHIDRRLFNLLAAENGGVRVMNSVGTIRNTRGMTPDALYNTLTGPDAPFARFKVTPLEQDIWHSRRYMDAGAAVTDESLAFSMGKWRDFSKHQMTGKGFVNKMQDLFKRGERPTDAAFNSMRSAMAKAGIPFAGISMPERLITGAVSWAGTKSSDVASLVSGVEGDIAKMSDDLGISRFAAQTRAYISPSERNISLPLELIEAAEKELGFSLTSIKGSSTKMLGLSPFETQSGKKSVNLIYELASKKSADALAGWLTQKTAYGYVGDKILADYGLDAPTLQKVVKALPEGGLTHGIGIGYLNGQAADMVYSALESLHGGIDADRSLLKFRAGLMKSSDSKVLRVGAFVLDRFMDSNYNYSHYERELDLAEQRYTALRRLAESPNRSDQIKFRLASELSENAMGSVGAKTLKAMDSITKRIPVIGGVAAGLGVLYYSNKKRKEQNVFDETLDRMPLESASAYSSYRAEMGLPNAPARRTMSLDPLATAGVVGNMDRNKVNHTLMGPNKYQDLFVL